MRFKTKVINAPIFEKMCQSLERLAKAWVLRLTSDRTHFIVAKPDVDSGLQVWGQIISDVIFEEMKIESANNNEIWLEVSGEFLHKALKSSERANDVTLKLTKKDDLPVLSFICQNQSRTGKTLTVVQDVPVRVMTPQQTRELTEPVFGNADVYIILPALSNVRAITDRMKSLSAFVTIAANNSGDFIMKVAENKVKVETVFKELINPELDASQAQLSQEPSVNRNPALFAEARVDVRDFQKFLQSYVVNPSQVVCCILDKRGLVLYVYVSTDGMNPHQCGSLTYYMVAKREN
ncbi:hypothetical protein SeMB42_g03916 [Synchytrium endobioticum]|uniref:Checkpoint protein n=1 Tax=Synchytrium endobioticum TaxID=286115 RepID=A0A507CDT0_9FUNG|nr:hypothetical protein SeLEV6574_g08111 [Synchytrium endobioticum]TPX45636.1 hypothetical protein SeMB42_g03916 [Synchytrium endobioticum]